MKKGWFSIGKLKDKKNKTPKQDKAKDADKEKKDALYENFLKDSKPSKKKSVENEYDPAKAAQVPANDENNGKNSNANKQNTKKPKSKDNQQQQKKTIEQMIDDLDPEEFSDLIANIKSKFPNSSTAWLSEAAFYLNNNIPSNVKDVLNVFNGSLDYPSNLLKENFKKKLIDLFNLFTKEELYQVQLSIIESIIPNIYLTGLSGPVGYLLFLQNLSLYLGENSNENVERLASAEVRNKYKEKPNVYLTQVWCLQTVGVLDLSEGLNVWKKLYSPMLDHKYFYQFGIRYLQHVLSNNSNSKDASDIIGVKDLIRVLKLKAASEHQEILEKVLPKLKLIVLSNQSDADIVNSFNELISSLNSFKNETQLEEFVISCLVLCLERNKQCFDVWYEYHSKTSGHSRDPLLDHLLANPNSIQIQKKAFRSALQKIGKFNDKQGQQTSYQSKDILKTMSNTKSCKSNFALLMLLALLTYVIYDTRLNGSFERSETARYLKRWKVYNYVQPGAIYIERNVVSLKRQFDVKYGPTVNSYVDHIVRQYDSNVRPTIDPVLGKVVNASTPYYVSLKENSVLAYRYAEKYYVTYTRQAGIFLEKNVFTGPLEISNLKIVANDVYEKVATAYVDAYRWASEKLASLVQQ